MPSSCNRQPLPHPQPSYNYKRLDQQGHDNDKAPAPDKDVVGKASVRPVPYPFAEPEIPSSIAQQDVGSKLPQHPASGPKAPKPLPVRVVNDALLTRAIVDDELSTFEKRTLKYARWGFFVAAVTLAVVAVTGIIFWGQLKEMSGQTDLLAIASRQARSDAKDASIAAASQLGFVRQQAQAAEDGVAAIKRQMRQDQRAWIKITSPEQLITTEGYPLVVPFHFLNTGKTTALNYTAETVVRVLPIEQEPTFDYNRGDHSYDVAGILYGNDSRDVQGSLYAAHTWKKPSYPSPLPWTRDENERFFAGRAYIVTFARVRYSDIFGVKHWTHFCNWSAHAPLTPTFKCANYNRVDDN